MGAPDAGRKAHPNRARLEVERMDWPTHLPDPEGDLRRELLRVRRGVTFWRTAALILLAFMLAEIAALALTGF